MGYNRGLIKKFKEERENLSKNRSIVQSLLRVRSIIHSYKIKILETIHLIFYFFFFFKDINKKNTYGKRVEHSSVGRTYRSLFSFGP